MMIFDYKALYNFCRSKIEEISEPTEADAVRIVDETFSALKFPDQEIKEAVLAELKHDVIFYGKFMSPVFFDGDSIEHKPWLTEEKRNSISWAYWERYKHYLDKTGKKGDMISSLDDVTDKILERIEDPSRPDNWAIRGMVVGYVQSGKTANYTGLICKAADAGYKMIIVLSGMHKDLRYQTQQRIDEGFIGSRKKKDNQREQVGVGTIRSRDVKVPPEVSCITTSDPNGDVNKVRSDVRIGIESNPCCAVVKKNVSVLNSLIEFLSGYTTACQKLPLLLIDDEADNASVNTKKYEESATQEENDITSINRLIRKILKMFNKSVYIGYTATPYANVFIDPDANSDEYGRDIFPSNFIVSMPQPPGYFGPELVFGSENDSGFFPGIIKIDEKEQDILIPENKKTDSTYVPKELPPSLIHAIQSFYLSCACREVRNRVRKSVLHNSMLIHVSRYKAAHGAGDERTETGLLKLIKNIVSDISCQINLRDQSLKEEFREIWEKEYYPVSKQIQDMVCDPLCTGIDFEDAYSYLPVVAKKLTVRVVNGDSANSLDYSDHSKDGLTVIAIGGDKLSRGLTLEGLSVSYFLRPAGAYDTLMQMGRWFGFRPGYVDLCRIYTTESIANCFRAISKADEHLRRQIEMIDASNRTPETYGMKIKQEDPRFRITSQNKMRTGGKVTGTPHSGALCQTYKFLLDPETVALNNEAVSGMISEMNAGGYVRENENRYYMWKDVPSEFILNHMEKLKLHPDMERKCGADLRQYIRHQNNMPEPEVTNWTVVLINNLTSKIRRDIGGCPDVGYSIRNPPLDGDIHPSEMKEYAYSKSNIMNSSLEEAYDLEDNLKKEILSEMNRDYERGKRDDGSKLRSNAAKPSESNLEGQRIRAKRSYTHGLLLIYPITWDLRDVNNPPELFGVAYSMPVSPTSPSEEFIATLRYLEEWELL